MRLSYGLIGILFVFSLTNCAWLPKGNDKTHDWSAQQFYNAGKDSLNDGDYEDAIKYYEGLEARYPYGRYAQQAQIEIAYAYYKFGEPESAIAAADRFIRLHPTHPNVDYTYYLKGLAHFSTKRGFLDRFAGEPDLSDRDPQGVRAAFESFRELVNRYPNSRYAIDAADRMAYLLNALARHDIRVAQYYMDRGAYVAVINRSKHVIENYQRAPAVEDALGMMATAYLNIGLNKLAADTTRVLKKNFPNSVYLKSGTDKQKRGLLSRLFK
ncbi:MAG TPA: outer membrane protein assembly factor BamD [Acidiferrobacteraceae bacterium]|nr:outer membrane protein assembly factor BamD [Acidiferrobacteraceae bacterium]